MPGTLCPECRNLVPNKHEAVLGFGVFGFEDQGFGETSMGVSDSRLAIPKAAVAMGFEGPLEGILVQNRTTEENPK